MTPKSTKGLRPFPVIESENEQAKGIMERLFRKAARGEIDAKALKLVESLRVPPETVAISVVYCGEKIGFTHQGVFPAMAPGIYLSTNEKYGPMTESAITAIGGITHYIGISAGIDANLAQIGFLQTRNKLSSVLLLDLAPLQVVQGMLRLYEYDLKPQASVASNPLFEALARTSHHPAGPPVYKLTVQEVSRAIGGISKPGRYFIYLSNAFSLPIFIETADSAPGGALLRYISGWAPTNLSCGLLISIAQNESIRNGSRIMFANADVENSIIIRKGRGGFSVSSFISANGETMNMEMQNAYFAEYGAMLKS